MVTYSQELAFHKHVMFSYLENLEKFLLKNVVD